MQDKEVAYDWQLPPYKPIHVAVNTGYGCSLVLTPRDFQELEQ